MFDTSSPYVLQCSADADAAKEVSARPIARRGAARVPLLFGHVSPFHKTIHAKSEPPTEDFWTTSLVTVSVGRWRSRNIGGVPLRHAERVNPS